MKTEQHLFYTLDEGEQPLIFPSAGKVLIVSDDDAFNIAIPLSGVDFWISELIRVKAELDKEVA